MAEYAGKHGFKNEELMPYGRQAVNGYDDRDEYEYRENTKDAPFFEQPLADEDKLIRAGEICLQRKDSSIAEGIRSTLSGHAEDGYPSAETIRGFSILNKLGKKTDKPYELISSLRAVGVADQSSMFDRSGEADKVDMTYQIAGLMSMHNFGPQTLRKGSLFFWDLPKSSAEADMINERIGRHPDKPLNRVLAFPRMYNPREHRINSQTMYSVLVENKLPKESDEHFMTVLPLAKTAVDTDKALRMIVALADMVTNGVTSGGEDLDEARATTTLKKYGLLDASGDDSLADAANKWKIFRALLFGGATGREEHMIVPRSEVQRAGPAKLVIRNIQENAFNELAASTAEANNFVAERIMGKVLSDCVPGNRFDALLF